MSNESVGLYLQSQLAWNHSKPSMNFFSGRGVDHQLRPGKRYCVSLLMCLSQANSAASEVVVLKVYKPRRLDFMAESSTKTREQSERPARPGKNMDGLQRVSCQKRSCVIRQRMRFVFAENTHVDAVVPEPSLQWPLVSRTRARSRTRRRRSRLWALLRPRVLPGRRASVQCAMGHCDCCDGLEVFFRFFAKEQRSQT
jgi:hypothetical protein